MNWTEILVTAIPVLGTLIGVIISNLSGSKKVRDSVNKLTETQTTIIEEYKNLNSSVQDLSNKFDSHVKLSDVREANSIRKSILDFCSEICNNPDKCIHTEENYDEIIALIDRYETYCANHPTYENNKAQISIKVIKDKYAEHLQHGDFLK